MAVNRRVSKDSFFDLDFDFDEFEQDYNTTSAEYLTDASITNHFPDYQTPVAGLESPHYASTEMPVPPYSNPIDYSTTKSGYMTAYEMFPMPDMSLPDELSMLAGGNYSQEEFCDFFNLQPSTPGTITAQQQVAHSAVSSLEQNGYAPVSDLKASNADIQAGAQSAGAATEDFYGLNVQATSQPEQLAPSVGGSPSSSPGPSPPSAAIELPPTPDSTSFDVRKCPSFVEDEEVLQQKLLGDGSTYEEFFNLSREKPADVIDVAPVDERTYQPTVADEVLSAILIPDKACSSAPEMKTRFISADPSNARECGAVVGVEVPVDDLTFGNLDSSTSETKSDSTELPLLCPPIATATDKDEIWNKDIAAIFSAEHFQQVPPHNDSDSNASTWSNPVANLALEPLSDEQLSFPEGFGMPLGDQHSATVHTQASDPTAGYNAAAGSLPGQNFVSNSFTNARPGDQYTAQQMQRYGQDVPQASEPWSYAPLDNATNVSPNITSNPQQRVYATPKKPSSKLAQLQHPSYYQPGFNQAGQRVRSTAASTQQDPTQRQQTMRNTHPSLMSSRKRKQDELVAAAVRDRAMKAAIPTHAHKRARTAAAVNKTFAQTHVHGTSVPMPRNPCPQPAHPTKSVKRKVDQSSMITILGHAVKMGGFLTLKNGRLGRVEMTSARDIHVNVLTAEDTARVKMDRRLREQRDGVQQFVDPAECFKQMQSGDGWLR